MEREIKRPDFMPPLSVDDQINMAFQQLPYEVGTYLALGEKLHDTTLTPKEKESNIIEQTRLWNNYNIHVGKYHLPDEQTDWFVQKLTQFIDLRDNLLKAEALKHGKRPFPKFIPPTK